MLDGIRPTDENNESLPHSHSRESYAAALHREQQNGTIDGRYAGHWNPVDVSPPAEGRKLPLDIVVDGTPYNTISTISVLGEEDNGTPHNPDRAVQLGRTHFALLRRPYSNEVFVTQLGSNALTMGHAEIEGNSLTAVAQDPEQPFATQVVVGSTKWEQASLSVQYDPRKGGSYGVELNGNPDAMAMVIQPLPPPTMQ